MMKRCITNPTREIPLLQPRKRYWAPARSVALIVSAWPPLGSIKAFAAAAITTLPGHIGTLRNEESAAGGGGGGDATRNVMEVYSMLKSELLHDTAFDFTDESRQWVHQMLDYNVPRGRLNRIWTVISCYQLFQGREELSDEENLLLCVLGWCIQWLQASTVVVDDIMDNSYDRRGQPCWFRLPQVGMIATNDAALLQSHIFRILKKHFSEKPYYVQLLDLFSEVGFQTASGQMLDAINPRQTHLSKYSMELYRCIAKYKSTYWALYLPVACALILAGERLDDHFEVEDILIQIARYYQIQNDYLDCFEDPEVTGKDGTDIEDGKCSWFIVKALEHANEEQKKILHENYGKADPTSVAKVKQVYASLDLEDMYKQYEIEDYEELKKSVEMHPSKVVQAIWTIVIEKTKRF